MIYRDDISRDKWIKRFPALKFAKNVECPTCGSLMVLDRPFISKDWVGIAARDCSCGNKGAVAMSPRPDTNKSPILDWMEGI